MNKVHLQLIFLIIFVLLVFLFGCTEKSSEIANELSVRDIASSKCVSLCKVALSKDVDINSGPCLGLVMTDWVCDVANNPRLPVDNLPQNQCADFRSGIAHHFVEVDANCKVINVN